jgi:DNA-binding transcriptional regulator YhcF (GntR family)
VVELLLDFRQADLLSTDTRQQLESVRTSARQMRRLVQDLLDITRIESGHLAVHPQGVDSAALVDEALGALRPLAEARSIRIEKFLPCTVPGIWADRQRIVQVLTILVGNAIQHVPEGGGISLSARSKGRELCFAVSDNGSGIPEERLPHLFDRFWHAPAPGSDGVGLGLAIARGIVEAHGGRIRAESQVGKGSTFYFTLPLVPDDVGADVLADREWGSSIAAITAPPLSDPSGEKAGRAEQEAASGREAAGHRSSRFLESVSHLAEVEVDCIADLAEKLRGEVLTALHLGHLRPDDRLPSIRQAARELGVPNHAVVRAYQALAAEGIVEKRERSGVYLAQPGRSGGELQGETARWVAEVLIGAWMHQIKVPQLPELIRRFTTAVSLHCLCVESTDDHRTALAAELHQQFGFRTSPLPVTDLPAGVLTPLDERWTRLQDADLLVTTSFHAPRVRQLAEELNKPLIVMTVHPEVVAAIEGRLAESGDLVVVCVDPAFGARVRASVGEAYQDRIRIVLAGDAGAVAGLDRSQPVLLTRAARQQLPDADLRMIVPLSPSFSAGTAWEISKVLVRYNMEAARA